MSKIFIVKDKNTKTTRLIMAATRGAVSKYLSSSFEIDPASPIDVANVMGGGNVKLEDATLVVGGDEGGPAPEAGGQDLPEGQLIGEPVGGSVE